MIEFYTLSWGMHIFITLMLGLCVLFQTLAMVLKFFSHKLNKIKVMENIFELAILLQIFVFSLLYGDMTNALKNGFLVPTGYERFRIIIFLVISIIAVIIYMDNKRLQVFAVIPAILIGLPIMEDIIGLYFPWMFIASLIFFLSRSIKICIFSSIALRTNISALSVTHAIDTLHTGVLFSENDGHILLSNHKMQKLMIAIAGRIFRNSVNFYDGLLSGEFESRYEKVELDGQVVYLLSDGTAWMFTKTDVILRRKKYIHISATEVSKTWTLTAKLQVHEQELRHKSEELKRTISNIYELTKEKEIDKGKMRVHDILGQRLTLLLRIIQQKDTLDHDLLKSLSKGLLDELKTEENEIEAKDELRNIQQIFADIGVAIKFDGKLPDNPQQSNLVIDIIRESSTNGVRHGLATIINIKSEVIKDEYKLTVSNNGHTNNKPIIPGSGIKTLKKKVSAQGGNLKIRHYPLFTLDLVLPGGDQYE